jgi:hypothetical protein
MQLYVSPGPISSSVIERIRSFISPSEIKIPRGRVTNPASTRHHRVTPLPPHRDSQHHTKTRFHKTFPMLPSPTITIFSNGNTPDPPEAIQLGQPPLSETTSFLIRLFPSLDPNHDTSVTVGTGSVTTHIDEDLLGAFRM